MLSKNYKNVKGVKGMLRVQTATLNTVKASHIKAYSTHVKDVKGEKLEVNDNIEEIKNIHIPAGINNPIAYLIKGTGFSKPYKNGYAVICEFTGTPVAGEEVLIFCKDGKIYAGEFLFEQDILVSIESVDGDKENILKENISRTSPVKMFISPSQIK